MNTKVKQSVTMAGFILLSVLASFATTGLVSAQGEIEKNGALVGGHSDTIPIQLKRGQMVEGKMIATGEPLMVTLNDPTGKEIQNYGSTTRGGFSYSAKIDGEHYIVITNPNTIAVHARGYTITWKILPATIPPGTGSGNITLWDRMISFLTPFLWVIGTVLFLFLVLSAPARVEREWVPFYIYRRIRVSIEDITIWRRK